jgi:ribonuclease D
VRLTRAKEVLAQVSESVSIPVENLLTPELVRQVCWDGPSDRAGALGAGGARPWQIALVAPLLESSWLREDPGSE